MLCLIAGVIALGPVDSVRAETSVDVIVAGGGAGGVPAALQAARMGAQTLLIEETPWLGGMMTTAGVSALDGNDRIRCGIHREFVEALWDHYGGPEAVHTGWVSYTMFISPRTIIVPSSKLRPYIMSIYVTN